MADAPAQVGVAAPPAPEEWFVPATRCWCGGREHAPSPCSPDYFVCARCGTHVARRRLRPERVADFYSLAGYWHARQREKAHPTLLERRALLERDGRVDRWMAAIERHTLGNRGTAVEIGCAEGTLLLRLRELLHVGVAQVQAELAHPEQADADRVEFRRARKEALGEHRLQRQQLEHRLLLADEHLADDGADAVHQQALDTVKTTITCTGTLAYPNFHRALRS